MLPDDTSPPKQTKGARTALRILDIAEELFAQQGYDGTSLRQIAERVGIKEPGLYNHFAGKQALYEAVLFRALNPMAQALAQLMEDASQLRDYTDLPSVMTDILIEHPQMASLFQQGMQGDANAIGNQLVNGWLEKLFNQGMHSMEEFGGVTATSSDSQTGQDRATLAINVIAMFNLTTGYFLAQRAFDSMAAGDLLAPDNIAKQKRLLHKVIRAMLIS
mgnify:CR=1 FL=1|jgi:AcrR family transcriptional regulator|tara:strand:- start:265 stop:921 length:657 start_codon:yes stop_codon:yes gene_type:complete